MDRLQAMHAFVRVVEAGSFSAVARDAATTQSAISKQVAALERHLGARLLARTTRSLSLTDEGERYFEHAKRLVAEVAEAEHSVRRSRGLLAGRLRVTASVAFGECLLMPMLRGFLAAHPQLQLELRLADGFTDLVEQGLDVALRIGELDPNSGLVARRIGSTQRGVFAHRDYLAARPARRRWPKRPADLTAHDCIVYTELATRNVWSFATDDGSSVSVRVQGRLATNSSEGVRAATLAALGVSYAPPWFFTEAMARGEIVRLLPDWRAPPLPIHLLTTPERRGAAKVCAFGDHIAAALAA
jgi:DNA-binding transcriptional LysR family regulator